MNINFSLIRVNNECDKMIQVMRDNYDSATRKLEIQDLATAINTKTTAEVTKDFVSATSFILSKTIAIIKGKLKGKKGAKASSVVSDPLWDTKKFEVGQWMSSLAYYNVTEIDSSTITVQNSFGNELQVSKDILEKMHSANHYKSERPMNMTELAEILETAGDNCFTVNFRK